MSLPARIESKIAHEPNTGCWLWSASIDSKGYGQLMTVPRPKARRLVRAHRHIYELLRGPVAKGRDLDHLCRVRSCVNPDHLEPVTRQTNLHRGEGFIGQNARKTHCPHGHPYAGNNLRVDRAGHRHCRTCERIWESKRVRRVRR